MTDILAETMALARALDRRLESLILVDDNGPYIAVGGVEEIARAILAAEARGRNDGLEMAAGIADRPIWLQCSYCGAITNDWNCANRSAAEAWVDAAVADGRFDNPGLAHIHFERKVCNPTNPERDGELIAAAIRAMKEQT